MANVTRLPNAIISAILALFVETFGLEILILFLPNAAINSGKKTSTINDDNDKLFCISLQIGSFGAIFFQAIILLFTKYF